MNHKSPDPDPITTRDLFHSKAQLRAAVAGAVIAVIGGGAITVWATLRAKEAKQDLSASEARIATLEASLRDIRNQLGDRKAQSATLSHRPESRSDLAAAQVHTQPPPEAPQPRIPNGSFAVNQQITVFGSGFYGRNTPLILQSVENQPGARLSLAFVIENEDEADYSFLLLNPNETASAVDDQQGSYPFIAADGIDTATPVTVPAGGRHTFTVSFQPLTAHRRSLRVRLTFEQTRASSVGFSVQGQRNSSAVRVDIPGLPIYRLPE